MEILQIFENDFDKRDENLFEESQNQENIYFNKSDKYNPFVVDKATNKLTKQSTKTFKIEHNNDCLNSDMQLALAIKRGRKKKMISKLIKSGHNKNNEDNIMRKIKTHLFEYIVNQLNLSLSDQNEKNFTKLINL